MHEQRDADGRFLIHSVPLCLAGTARQGRSFSMAAIDLLVLEPLLEIVNNAHDDNRTCATDQ